MNYAVRIRPEPHTPWGILNVFEVNDYRTPGTSVAEAEEKCVAAAQKRRGEWQPFFPSAQIAIHKGDYRRCNEVNNHG